MVVNIEGPQAKTKTYKVNDISLLVTSYTQSTIVLHIVFASSEKHIHIIESYWNIVFHLQISV